MVQSATVKTWRNFMKENLFFLVTLGGVILGISIGLCLRPCQIDEDTLLLISYPGELFMRLLKLMVLPFVISCIIIGTAGLNVKKNGRIALRTVTYFLSTSAINVVLGLVLVVLIHPGQPESHLASYSVNTKESKILDGFLDMGRNIVPDNLFQAAFQQTATIYVPDVNAIENKTDTETMAMKREIGFRDGTDTIGIICFCIMFGSVLGTLGPEKKVVVDFFNTTFQVLLKMLMGAIWLTPLGVGSIICAKIISIPNLTHTLAQISWFIVTMIIGVLIYQLIILQIIYFVFVRKNPFKFYWTFKPSVITGFATASKAAAYPITFRLFDDVIKLDKRVSRFILPIGTLNMDGTAMFLAVSTVFIAQLNDIPLGIGEYTTIGLACTAMSTSSATVPSAALVLVLMLCSIINTPTEDVSLLFAVDWLVDRLRTTNNLLGDCYACAVIESLSKKELSLMAEEAESPTGDTIIADNTRMTVLNQEKNVFTNPKYITEEV